MLRFLACFSCEQKIQNSAPFSTPKKTISLQPISTPKSILKEDLEEKKDTLPQRKMSRASLADSEFNMRSTNATTQKHQEMWDEDSVLEFANKLQMMELGERKRLEYEFVKKHCFARGAKYVVERPWSIQYTEFLSKNKSSLRQVNNDLVLSEEGKILTGYEYSKDYFVVSKRVWMLIQYLYGGGPEIERDRVLPIKELPAFGLTNNRFSCYLNSGLQAMFSIPEFVDYFYNECFTKIKHKTKHPEKYLSFLTWKFLQTLSKSTDNASDLGSLRKYIESKFPEIHQHDCQEFLRFYISRLQEELNPRALKRQQDRKLTQQEILDDYDMLHCSIVDSLFHGQISSYIRCSNCENISIAYDPIMEITLEMSDLSLEKCLQNHFNAEKLADYYECERCLKLTRATRQLFLEKAPVYLMVTVKRFLQNHKKNSDDLQYPLQLQLDQYFKKTPKQSVQYDLQSVVIHRGDTDRGHYYLYTKRLGKWYQLNDEKVRRVSIQNYLQAEAYILIYKLE